VATYDVSVRKADRSTQQDLIDHKEHCSAEPEKLATVGRAPDRAKSKATREIRAAYRRRGRRCLQTQARVIHDLLERRDLDVFDLPMGRLAVASCEAISAYYGSLTRLPNGGR
jgi:hypothetical protein